MNATQDASPGLVVVLFLTLIALNIVVVWQQLVGGWRGVVRVLCVCFPHVMSFLVLLSLDLLVQRFVERNLIDFLQKSMMANFSYSEILFYVSFLLLSSGYVIVVTRIYHLSAKQIAPLMLLNIGTVAFIRAAVLLGLAADCTGYPAGTEICG